MYYDYSLNSYAESCSVEDLQNGLDALERMEQKLLEQQEVMANCMGVSHMAVIDSLRCSGYKLVSQNPSAGTLKFAKGSKQALLGYFPVESGISCLAVKMSVAAVVAC